MLKEGLNLDKIIVKEKIEKIIVVGASTGGIEALKVFLKAFNDKSPPILVVQHILNNFSDSLTSVFKKEIELDLLSVNKMEFLKNNTVYFAGKDHLTLKQNGEIYYVRSEDSEHVSGHKPSVDVLFGSVAKINRELNNIIGVLLTGMGEDGARGLLELKNRKAFTIAQDEKTSLVFGMPKVAITLNGASLVLPLEEIAPYIIKNLL